MPVAYGDDVAYTSDTPISCDVIPTDMYGVYSIGQYTCAAGYFLPADGEACAACPSGSICNGGIYTFNTNEFQGLVLSGINGTVNNLCADNFPTTMYAKYQISTYDCAAGYYLPANVDACTKCPANSYCPGGTYTFNATTSQGITACGAGLYAPAGMWLESQCGHMLHFGGDVLYLHQSPANPAPHRLFAQVDGVVYSANAVLRDMNADTFPKMSYGATHGLHVMIKDIVDGQEMEREYLIHDDSVK